MPINPNSLSGSADKLTLAFAPSNSTPTVEGHTDATNQLSAILNGVDDKILHSEPYDVVGGRLDWVSASSIRWSFLNSNQIRLYNPTSAQWELVKCSAEPTLLNNADDMNGTALAVDKIYDVFAEYDSSTSFTLKCSRWASYGAGTSSRVAAYAAGTTYAIGDRVTYGGHDWVKQSTAAAGTTPVAGNDWVDNGTSVSGDFAGLYRHDGVLVSSSSTTGKSRRWLGIIYTYNNSGTVNFKDDVNYRYVSNFYNTKIIKATTNNSSSNWTWGTSALSREWNNGTGQNYASCVFAETKDIQIAGLYYTKSDGITGARCLEGFVYKKNGGSFSAISTYYPTGMLSATWQYSATSIGLSYRIPQIGLQIFAGGERAQATIATTTSNTSFIDLSFLA